MPIIHKPIDFPAQLVLITPDVAKRMWSYQLRFNTNKTGLLENVTIEARSSYRLHLHKSSTDTTIATVTELNIFVDAENLMNEYVKKISLVFLCCISWWNTSVNFG
jgi:hypothetical protein